MNTLNKFRAWAAGHPKLADGLRIALGLILVWKGIFFLLNLDLLHLYLKDTGLDNTIFISIMINCLVQFIISLNLLGGICITLNINTRLFCMLNLPVVFGAVFIVNMQRGSFQPHTEFWLSLFVLMLIVGILLTGTNSPVTTRRSNGAV